MSTAHPRGAEPTIVERAVQISALDGYPLAVTLFEPSVEPASGHDLRSIVQIQSATAVERGIYVKYSRYLASRGFTVLSFDYRGTGESLRGDIRSFQGRMRDWGQLDLEGVLRYVAAHYGDHRHLAVAHSVGGQILGLAPSVGRLEKVYAVAAQWGSWRLWPAPRRYGNKVLFHGIAPLLIKACGYFPGSWLGMGDLPPRIGGDWMQWCRSDAYIQDDAGQPLRPHYDALRAHVRWNGFTDDVFFGPAKAIEHMAAMYPNARSEVCHIDPRDVGAGPIGHFGFFRSRFRDSLWRLSADWLAKVEPAR